LCFVIDSVRYKNWLVFFPDQNVLNWAGKSVLIQIPLWKKVEGLRLFLQAY
jgi:hypothetical protein